MSTLIREALIRLSAAAAARDNTMGDACTLLAAKAELSDANKVACAALAAPQQPVAWLEQVTLTSGNHDKPTKEWRVTQNPSTSNALRRPLYL